jgi:ABC-type polar amino acid transport system ATPase subunit
LTHRDKDIGDVLSALRVVPAFESAGTTLLPPPNRGGYTDGNSGESGCALLNQISLAAHSDKFPNTLYGVQQQRVALAGTLVVRLGLVLFDELLSNLDAKLNKYLKIFVN